MRENRTHGSIGGRWPVAYLTDLVESHVGFAARGLGSRGLGRDHSMCGRRAKGLRGLNAGPEGSCAQAGHTTGPANGEVGHWLGGSLLRLRSRPDLWGGVFQRTGPGPAAPAELFRLASGPRSNRACGSPAHGSPTSFIVQHAQPGSAPFR